METNKMISESTGVVFHDDENQYYSADGFYIDNTTQDNELIHEFMGYQFVGENLDPIVAEKLRFHDSWDWLMLVIEETDHTSYEPIESIEDALATRSLKDTYKAVAEYVKEYHNKYHKTVHYSGRTERINQSNK